MGSQEVAGRPPPHTGRTVYTPGRGCSMGALLSTVVLQPRLTSISLLYYMVIDRGRWSWVVVTPQTSCLGLLRDLEQVA